MARLTFMQRFQEYVRDLADGADIDGAAVNVYLELDPLFALEAVLSRILKKPVDVPERLHQKLRARGMPYKDVPKRPAPATPKKANAK